MTTYHRYLVDDEAIVSLSELATAIRRFDDSYRFDGDALLRGDRDCALQIDVTERGSEIFDGDIDLLLGFASKRRDYDALVSRLNNGICMVTMQVVSFSDELAIEHVFRALNGLHPGLAVYEGGIFDTPEPAHPWVTTSLNVLRRVTGHSAENRGEQ
jgi:hypothetical protein